MKNSDKEFVYKWPVIGCGCFSGKEERLDNRHTVLEFYRSPKNMTFCTKTQKYKLYLYPKQ